MRQSLSVYSTPPSSGAPRRTSGASGAVAVAIALSGLVAAAAMVDQTSVHSLSDHATAMYAQHGKEPSHGLLYGLIYTVAGLEALLWLGVLKSVRPGGRLAPVATLVAVAISALLALTLLLTTEYGKEVFPPVWGVLAGLPAAAGAIASALLLRRLLKAHRAS